MTARNLDASQLKYEREFYVFLKSRIQRQGGSIELHNITGHLSQLKPEVRNALGTSKNYIADFINKHCDTFMLNKNIVSLISSNNEYYDSDDRQDRESSLPVSIENGKGVIVKITPAFGFIKTQHPVKSSVFFRASHFGFNKETNLTECGLNIGTMVTFNAVKDKKDNFSSQYCARKVWKNSKNDEENGVVQNQRKKRETGLYDPINLEGEGVVQNVFSTHGFIFANGDRKNGVFFYKNRVVNYENIVDLTKIFQPGDLVEFSAHRSTKENTKARWEAIKVWKKSERKSVHEDKVKTINELTDKSKLSCKSISDKKLQLPHKSSFLGKISPTSKSNSSDVSSVKSNSNSSDISSKKSKSNSSIVSSHKRTDLPGFYYKSVPAEVNIKPKEHSREMIYDQPGKIYPRANGVVIKFGNHFKDLVDGDSSHYYICGVKVTEISWEFTEGDSIKFDAVKIKSAPGWKAVLVWMGEKPDVILSPHLGDIGDLTDEEVDEGDKKSDEEMCEFIDDYDNFEFPDNTESSASGYQMSLSSHSSLKSDSMLSDMSDLKTNKVPYCGRAETMANSEDRNTSNKGFKVRNLCNSPAYSRQQSSSSSSKESSSSSSKESEISYKSKDSKLSHKSLEHGKSNEVELNFETVKNCIETKDSDKNTATVASDITNLENANPEIVLKKSDILNQKNDYNSISPNTSECPENSEIIENLKNMTLVTEAENEIKKAAAVRKHENIIGKITKVYSTFAEVKSPDFQNPVAFSWNIFYCNKNSMNSLGLNDLREVLKAGQTIYFNNFEIVDDDGQCWQKVSLAWTGNKPLKVAEITPDQFILQNNLSVTVKDESPDIEPENTVKKFLSGYDEISDNIAEELGVSRTESCSENDGLTYDLTKSFIGSEVVEEPSSEFKSLSSMISQKLMKNRDLIMDPKVDLNSLSSEIVSLVLLQYNIKESSHISEKLKETSNFPCSCQKIESSSCKFSRNANMKDKEMQTISTGEIMAQHIFTEY